MEFELIMQNLKKRVYHPIYLLQGEEPYCIDQVSDYIEKNVLHESERGFNQTIFYGKDTEVRTIVETSLRYPMMAEKQVIIVREAQSLREKDLGDMAPYAEKPMLSTILVINYKYKILDARIKLYKAINKNGVILTTKKLYESQIPAWVDNWLKGHGYTITPQASHILTDFVGTELSKVANELNKLIIAVKDTKKITPELIERHIGVSKDFNTFELLDALGTKNILKANRITNFFAADPRKYPLMMIIPTLYSYFSKMFAYHFLKDKSEHAAVQALGGSPFYIKRIITASRRYNPTKLYEIIGILREYDMKGKGVGVSTTVDRGELLKEMIYKILH